MKFTTRPQEFEAVQWTGSNQQEIIEFCKDLKFRMQHQQGPSHHSGPTFEGDRCVFTAIKIGTRRLKPGEWLVQYQTGQFWHCDPATFDKLYQPAAPTEEHGITSQILPRRPFTKAVSTITHQPPAPPSHGHGSFH